MKSPTVGILLVLLVSVVCMAQATKFVGISDVAAAGAVDKDTYVNSFLKLSVYAPNAALKLNPVITQTAQRARLLEVLAEHRSWNDTYTFAVIADLLAVNPLTKSPGDYVRTVRQSLERQGSPTVQPEFPVTIGGVQFTGAVLQEQVPSGQKYYHGIYTTFRKGYILSFDVEAPSQDKLSELVNQLVKFAN